MSTQRIAVFGLTGLLMLAGLPTQDAHARRKGLRQGADGPAVERVQRNLSRAGFSTAVDGAFGPATKATLMRWERWKHRRVDGIATRRDRRALRRSARFGTRLLHSGMRGRDVRGLQWHLGRVGFGTSIDGAFGPLTKAAVMRWEGSRGRGVNGVATRRDQNALKHTRRNRTRRTSRPRVNAWISRRGFAHISPSAPRKVRRLIRAGNRIAKAPYTYGGGHGSWNDSGYDCSGSVSYVLHHAGLLSGAARPSGGFMNWAFSGRGKWVTVYANSGHMWLKVAGIRFDTTDRERDGTRWHRDIRSSAGYAVRHPGRIG
ncbi:MAG: peptidoglycan-binding domain-containing protein [Thermoleophilaceae bacterium]